MIAIYKNYKLRNKYIKLNIVGSISIFIFFLLSTCHKCCAQSELINSLNTHLKPLKSFDFNSSSGDIESFIDQVGNVNIYALGEATHGTREFFLAKNRLIRYLITTKKINTIIIEGDFSGAISVDDYISKGEGNAKDAVRKLNIVFWQNQDFVDLVEWIKSYNEALDTREKVKFFGCDIKPKKILKDIIEGKVKFREKLSLECLKGLSLFSNYSILSKQKKTELNLAINELKIANLDESDHEKSELYKRSIKTIFQAISYFENKNGLRDKYMAENIKWILDTLTSEKKAVIWAHNLHISKTSAYEKIKPMGYFLKQHYKEFYYALGFAFHSGYISAINLSDNTIDKFYIPPTKYNKKSFENTLTECYTPNFFLDFNKASENILTYSFLVKNSVTRNIGSHYLHKGTNKINLVKPIFSIYDGIFFVKKSTETLVFK